MSVQTLHTAASGMHAMETKLEVIANNLANVNTTAFKRGRANFEDQIYRHEILPGTADSGGNITPTGISIGMGTQVQSIQTDFEQGVPVATGNPMDVSITGNGFFTVTNADGSISYTRAGNFGVDGQSGSLVIASAGTSRPLDPPMTIPADATSVSISPEGIVAVMQPGTSSFAQIGQIQLATFQNPEGLLKLGENLYSETDASGTVVTANPGQQGLGTLRQSALEGSNVKPVDELINLIQAQRNFELNSEAVKAGDQMMQLIASLRRF